MAARRLLILMLILLGTSTLAAALVPAPPPRDSDTTESTSTTTGSVPTGGELVKAKLDADAKRPERVRVALGDQVALQVRSREPGQIEIPALGLIDDVLPLDQAKFNILATRRGRFEIQRVEPEELVGVLEVGPAEG